MAEVKTSSEKAHDALDKIARVFSPLVMAFSQGECVDEPIPDSAVVLHFMGSGASDQVTAGEVREAMAAIARLRVIVEAAP